MVEEPKLSEQEITDEIIGVATEDFLVSLDEGMVEKVQNGETIEIYGLSLSPEQQGDFFTAVHTICTNAIRMQQRVDLAAIQSMQPVLPFLLMRNNISQDFCSN